MPKGEEDGSPVKKRGNDSVPEVMAGSSSTDGDSSDEVKVLLFQWLICTTFMSSL